MAKTSEILLENFGLDLNIVGEPLKTNGWYGSGVTNHVYTVSFKVSNFQGIVKLQATLLDDPTDNDWFDLETITYPHPDVKLTNSKKGETSTLLFNYNGIYALMRVVVDRSYLPPVPWDYGGIASGVYGRVEQVLLNQ